ncbi:hypothetical protein SCA6_012598 [Theobroma cacao]
MQEKQTRLYLTSVFLVSSFNMENVTPELALLPGFRFHPTEEELVDYYLKGTAMGKIFHSGIIGFLNIYKHNPWDLPGMAEIGEREWYFFVPRERRAGHGGKPNRTTKTGYWKATGSDRHIRCPKEPREIVGLRKTLVFYTGKAPKGCRTDWVMNEYRLISNTNIATEDIVLAKIYRKATSLRVLEQKAEELVRTSHQSLPSNGASQSNFDAPLSLQGLDFGAERGEELFEAAKKELQKDANSEALTRVGSMPAAEPIMDWTSESVWAQLRSPSSYAMW